MHAPRLRPVFMLLALAVASAVASAAEPVRRKGRDAATLRLLDGLEERGMPDVILWVLDRVEKDSQLGDQLKQEVPFRRAVALVATSRTESSSARRAEIFDQAAREIDAFLRAHPEGDRAIQAYLQKGNLLVERGRAKAEQARRPGEDAARLRSEAVPLFDDAIKTLQGAERKPGAEITDVTNAEDAVLKLLRGVDAKLKGLRGEDGGDKEDKAKEGTAKAGGKPQPKPKKPARKPGNARQMAELEERQDELRGMLLKTRLLVAGAHYEKSKALEPKSKEWEAALTESARRYRVLYDNYRSRGAGLFARYYEGRNYAALGKRKEALAALADIRNLDGEGFVPALRAKAINSSLECWLEDKQYDEFDERLQKLSLAPLTSDRIDQDWLGMKYRASLLLKRRAEALGDNQKPKRAPLLRDAKRLAIDVAKINKDFAAEAKSLLAELGKEMPDDLEAAATFGTAMEAVRGALAAMQSGQGKLKEAEARKDQPAVEAARKEVAADRVRVIAGLRKAMPLAGDDDRDTLNAARHLLTYLLYEDKRLHEAATMGEFLLRRYPNAKGSQQAANIAMASWQQLQRQAVVGWADEAKAQCVEIAEAIMRTWPDRPEAADAAVIAIVAAAEARSPERLVEILGQVPATAPRRGEVLLRGGTALSREVREKSQLDPSARPAEPALAAWRAQAGKAIDEGLAGIAAGAAPTTVEVAAALARAQMALDDDDSRRVSALLEHPAYGPWTVVSAADKSLAQGPLATASATAALRFFILSDQGEKATLAMRKLEELAGAAGPEASARLTTMYQSMGRDLHGQLESLASGPQAGTPEAKARAAAILTGFEKFLEGVAKDPKPSAQLWAATTYLNLGSGEGATAVVPKTKADGYLDRAAAIYEAILAAPGPETAKLDEPSIRAKMANVYRERGKWDDAQKQMDWILADKRRQNRLEFQIQAAKLAQAAAEKGLDNAQQAAFYNQAIGGYRRKTAAGEAVAWGWAGISNKLEKPAFDSADEKALDARNKFFDARLRAVKCRMAKAEASPQARDKELQMAFDYIRITFQLHPELGGDDTKKQFDKLLKEIEKRQNKKPQGLDGLKQAAEAAAG